MPKDHADTGWEQPMTTTENGAKAKDRWDPGVHSYASMGY